MTDGPQPAAANDGGAQAPTLTSSIPLSQQTNKILNLMGSTPEPAAEPAADPAKGEPAGDPKPAPAAAPAKTGEEEPVTPTTGDDKQDGVQEPTPVAAEKAAFLEDDDEPLGPAPKPLKETNWQEYAVNHGVKPISIVGKIGDELREFKVYDLNQLPAEFEFRSQLDMAKATKAIVDMENFAKEKQNEFFQLKQQENVRQFEIADAQDVAADLRRLQRAGIVPEFKYEDSDARFNTDPAVKEANAIYELYKNTNQQYAIKYQGTGRSYRISYADAADKYYAMNERQKAQLAKDAAATAKPDPKKPQAPAPKTPAQRQRDTAGNRGGAAGGDGGAAKASAFKGMSFTDINRLVKAGKI